MERNLDLKQIEKKAFRTNWEDGFMDILLAFAVLFMGLPIILERFGVTWGFITDGLHVISLSIYVIALIAFTILKKIITIPRIGKIKFSVERKKKKYLVTLILVVSVIFGFLMYLMAKEHVIPKEYRGILFLGIFVLNFLVVFSLMAALLDFPRLYFYQFLYIIPIILGKYIERALEFKWAMPILFTISFLTMSIAGIIIFIRFLKKYPLPLPKEVADGQ